MPACFPMSKRTVPRRIPLQERRKTWALLEGHEAENERFSFDRIILNPLIRLNRIWIFGKTILSHSFRTLDFLHPRDFQFGRLAKSFFGRSLYWSQEPWERSRCWSWHGWGASSGCWSSRFFRTCGYLRLGRKSGLDSELEWTSVVWNSNES